MQPLRPFGLVLVERPDIVAGFDPKPPGSQLEDTVVFSALTNCSSFVAGKESGAALGLTLLNSDAPTAGYSRLPDIIGSTERADWERIITEHFAPKVVPLQPGSQADRNSDLAQAWGLPEPAEEVTLAVCWPRLATNIDYHFLRAWLYSWICILLLLQTVAVINTEKLNEAENCGKKRAMNQDPCKAPGCTCSSFTGREGTCLNTSCRHNRDAHKAPLPGGNPLLNLVHGRDEQQAHGYVYPQQPQQYQFQQSQQPGPGYPQQPQQYQQPQPSRGSGGGPGYPHGVPAWSTGDYIIPHGQEDDSSDECRRCRNEKDNCQCFDDVDK